MSDQRSKDQRGVEIYADMEVLRHTLGIDNQRPRKEWGYRNYFNAEDGHSDLPSLKRLEEAGLMERYRPGYWRATHLGMDVVGLTSQEAKRSHG